MELIWSSRFTKKLHKYIKKHPNLERLIWDKIRLFEKDPFNLELRNHKLSGKLKELRAIVIEYDCRLTYYPVDKDKALLIGIGSHEDVY